MDSLLKFVSFFSPNSRKYLIYHLISNKTLGINFSPLSIYSKNCKTIQETNSRNKRCRGVSDTLEENA